MAGANTGRFVSLIVRGSLSLARHHDIMLRCAALRPRLEAGPFVARLCEREVVEHAAVLREATTMGVPTRPDPQLMKPVTAGREPPKMPPTPRAGGKRG